MKYIPSMKTSLVSSSPFSASYTEPSNDGPHVLCRLRLLDEKCLASNLEPLRLFIIDLAHRVYSLSASGLSQGPLLSVIVCFGYQKRH